jgi:D-alanyl-D-alanine carboxypeptidase
MNKILSIVLAMAMLAACRKSEVIAPEFYACNLNFTDSSYNNPDDGRYRSLLSGMTADGVVGVTMAVYRQQNGIWVGAAGKADLYNDVDMQPCNITRVGSTVKMFTAATVLKLAEEGKLDLDDKISNYLGGDVISRIENADRATVRQLLQHSAGVYNYIQNLQFQTASTNDLIREWQPYDLLQYAYHKNAYFAPGEDVAYSNTGYIMLGMMIGEIEGKPFYEVFKEKIFEPLGLNSTFFAADDPVPDGIVRGYVDLYSNLQVVESTYYSGWDYYTADGGLISTPYDLNVFFRALMAGEVISAGSLDEMLSWQAPLEPDPEFFPISYGLGIFKIETPYGTAYMHSGDAIGYYANMIYFPDDSTTIVYAVNSNYGKIDQYVSTREAMEKIMEVVRVPGS